MSNVVLENATLRLSFDSSSGALVGIADPQTGWQLLDRPRLGLSFRLLAPLPSRRNNAVYGEQQAASSITRSPDGQSIRIVWDGVVPEHGGPLDVCIEMEVALGERHARWQLTVDNRSDVVIENVYCPYLGDVRPPDGAAQLDKLMYNYARADVEPLWPRFHNTRGYYGFDYPVQAGPAQAAGAPAAPFVLLHGGRQGLYMGVGEPSSELVAWFAELRPGYGSSIDGRVPTAPTIGAHDVCTRVAALHLPYIQPGERRSLTPVLLETYQGDWQSGVDIYTAWRRGWMQPARPPAWAQDVHAWQQIHINSPEDELRVPFRELVGVGEECARHGVQALQLVGWNRGGQDQGNPSHDPDPRLGTPDELRAAIAAIQALGVKVVLFTKFTWADRATPWFREQLIRYAIKDPYGDYYVHPGYMYQTATQMLDINTKRLIPMCFLSEEYLQVCEREFRKVLELGADGMLFDECLHHGPALLCFDTSHGHRAGAPVYANDRVLIERLRAIADTVNPEFLMAGEACYDWEMEAYSLSYHRSESVNHLPLSRYMLPEGQFMTAVTGFDDRNMLNQCLMYRYIVSYEPYNFKGRLDDFPLTMDYGRRMDALRAELREWLWDGEFRYEAGAEVLRADGEPHRPFAVFVRRDGAHAVVVANYDLEQPISVEVRLHTGATSARYRLVDDPTWRPVAGGVMIPPASAVVLIEG